MDDSFKEMDKRSVHHLPHPRAFALLPSVETVGFMPGKTDWVRRTFATCNFSFILSGSGVYRLRGVEHRVAAPCVLLQWPGEPMDYGPDAGGSWSELFLIYPGSCETRLRRSGAFTPGEPAVRTLSGEVAEDVARLEALARASRLDPDAVDAACWALIVASYSPGGPVDADHRAVARCRDHLRRHLAGSFDAHAMAAAAGMSLSALRRHWVAEQGSATFREYRDQELLQRSCRLLVETSAPVKEIAGRLGFADVYYFSRRFHQLAGCTPTAYRRAHAVHA